MGTPLSIFPYESRFNTDDTLPIYKDSYNFINMGYQAYYGGSAVQAQELNELQENIQNQISQSNIILESYLEFSNNTNVSSLLPYTEYTLIPVNANTITPLQS